MSAGPSILIEDSGRRMELAMYCLSPTIQVRGAGGMTETILLIGFVQHWSRGRVVAQGSCGVPCVPIIWVRNGGDYDCSRDGHVASAAHVRADLEEPSRNQLIN